MTEIFSRKAQKGICKMDSCRKKEEKFYSFAKLVSFVCGSIEVFVDELRSVTGGSP